MLHPQEKFVALADVLIQTSRVEHVVSLDYRSGLYLDSARIRRSESDSIDRSDVRAATGRVSGYRNRSGLRYTVIEAEHRVVERHRSAHARSIQISDHG